MLVREAVLHCAGVPTGWKWRESNVAQFKEIKRWHVEENGWKDIGYHYVICADGEIIPGRPLEQVGAHVMRHNYGKLGILMIERYKITHIGQFSDWFMPIQKRSVRLLCTRHEIRDVTGHNYYANKLCPGFKVRAEDFAGWSMSQI